MRFESRLFGSAAIMIVVFALAGTSGCGGSAGEGEKVVGTGDTVSMTYKGTLDDGSVFDSTMTGNSFKFVAGAGQVIPGFDQAVLGMVLSESKTFTIPDSLAYGSRNEPILQTVARSFFPEDITPEAGSTIQLQHNQGHPSPALITEVTEDSVALSLDNNHPLAGKNLTFEITIVGINSDASNN